jgi:RNA polymerase sigma-70 factor (ECF subfamily)
MAAVSIPLAGVRFSASVRSRDEERRLPPPTKTVDVRLEQQQQALALIRRCLAGDAAAWEEIVRTHNRRIYNLCYRFTGSSHDAEDLTQEVFIKIYRTLKSYEAGKGGFVTWISTLTRNLLVDHYRAQRQERLTDPLEAPAGDEESLSLAQRIPDTAPSPEFRMGQQDRQAMVRHALQQLSPELRECVILRDLQDMDYREIAKVLKVPEGTVKSRINRGRTELARLLERTYKQA